jgi:lysophospholipase L1-like esterase
MKRLLKWIIVLVILAVVVVAALGLYVAVVAGVDVPGISGALRTEGSAPSSEVLAAGTAVEDKITNAIEDKSAFVLELTSGDLTDLIRAKIDSDVPVRDPEVGIHPGEVSLSGKLNGRVPVPFSGSVLVALEAGEITLEISKISVGAFGLPGALKDELQPVIDDVVDLNEQLREAGATQIQELRMEEGKVTVVGLQSGGRVVSDITKEGLLEALSAAGKTGALEPPGADVVPPGTTGGRKGPELYLALGDSLAANVGVARPEDGYVSRFHGYLERETGRSLGLMNLGISGESSISIYDGQLQMALDEIEQRNNDGDPATKVSFLTIDLGANDLIGHLGSGDCHESPRESACQRRIEAALSTFEDNFEDILSKLGGSLESGAEMYVMTVYNPFDFGIGLPFEEFTNEIVERLNAIIEKNAREHGAKLADAYTIMKGNAAAWTHMLEGDIHPISDGFQALAFTFVQAREQ